MSVAIKPNSEFSHYRIVSRLGAGGMGEVFLAEDKKLGRKIAIKFLDEARNRDPNDLKRFVQEAQAASALNHPNIITVYEIGDHQGRNYIAVEYIDGQNLRQRITARERISLKSVIDIVIQVADALSAAHSVGITHRDIKPENIMLRRDGYVKVVDFGLAKLTAGSAQLGSFSSDDTMLTSPGMILGTVSYMSPEQARGNEVDQRSDIFSLGVVLYELISYRNPFAGETSGHTIVSIVEKTPPPFSLYGLNIPPDLEKIAMRALEKKLDRRYSSAAEMASDLRAIRSRIEFEAELDRSAENIQEQPTVAYSTEFPPHFRAENTIAVLPFLNMSPGEGGDYFSDGLAEELLNVLSKIEGFRVAARTSAFSFKGKQVTVEEIGRALKVRSVLEGSIRTAGNRVRIAVQLVNAEDGYQLWSQTYDRTMDDIFAVQDDIAGTVVEELRAMLVGEDFDDKPGSKVMAEVAQAVKGRAADPEAQRLMLLGRYFLDRTTKEDTEKAVEYYREALAIDPDFALGHAELGRALSVQAGKAWGPLEDGYAAARTAAETALRLEPDLAEAHALLGRIQSAYDQDVRSGLGSYEKALQLAPGNSLVMDGASILKMKLGLFTEALELSRRVVEQDPLSSSIWHNLGLISHAAGRLDESNRALTKAIELSPNRQLSTAMLALVQLDQSRAEDALETVKGEPEEFWKLWAEAILFHAVDRGDESDASLAAMIGDSPEGDAYQIAEVYSMRGETDEAFRWLGVALDARDPGISHLKADPRFKPLYGDPRWQALLKKIGLDV